MDSSKGCFAPSRKRRTNGHFPDPDECAVAFRSKRCVGLSASRRRRSEEHTSELQSLMRISYAVFCLKKNNRNTHQSQQAHENTNKPQSKKINTYSNYT